jgi:hypothetical protein
MRPYRHLIPQRAAATMTTRTPMPHPMLKANSENKEPSNIEVDSWTRKFTPGWNTLAFVGVGHAVVPILLALCQ